MLPSLSLLEHPAEKTLPMQESFETVRHNIALNLANTCDTFQQSLSHHF